MHIYHEFWQDNCLLVVVADTKGDLSYHTKRIESGCATLCSFWVASGSKQNSDLCSYTWCLTVFIQKHQFKTLLTGVVITISWKFFTTRVTFRQEYIWLLPTNAELLEPSHKSTESWPEKKGKGNLYTQMTWKRVIRTNLLFYVTTVCCESCVL